MKDTSLTEKLIEEVDNIRHEITFEELKRTKLPLFQYALEELLRKIVTETL